MRSVFKAALLSTAFLAASAQAVSIDLIEGADDPETEILNALIAPGSGVTVLPGSFNFVGDIGDGTDPNTAQSGTFTNLNLTPNNPGLPTVQLSGGVVLTSGTANIPASNTNTSFDPYSPTTGGDADLTQLLIDKGAPSSTTNDSNSFSFDFTLAPGDNAVQMTFVFGSDEFPDQGVTDVFAVFVDGTNYAFFPDGSLVSFVQGANADQFIDNNFGTGNYDFEYDGFSFALTLTGLIDTSLSTHTLKIAIADTSDSIFDSGVFLGPIISTFTEGGGGIDPPNGVPAPGALLLLGAGLIGLGAIRRRR